MAAETLHGAHEGLDGKRRKDEGDAEAERIDEEQADAVAHRVLARGNGEYRRQHRPDTRRPAEGEGEADDIGADEARRARVGVITRLAVQNGQGDDAQK